MSVTNGYSIELDKKLRNIQNGLVESNKKRENWRKIKRGLEKNERDTKEKRSGKEIDKERFAKRGWVGY